MFSYHHQFFQELSKWAKIFILWFLTCVCMCIAWGYHKLLKWMEKPFERKKTIRKPIMNFKLKKGERKCTKKLVRRARGNIHFSARFKKIWEGIRCVQSPVSFWAKQDGLWGYNIVDGLYTHKFSAACRAFLQFSCFYKLPIHVCSLSAHTLWLWRILSFRVSEVLSCVLQSAKMCT